MKYFTVDYKGKLKAVSKKEYFRQMEKDNTFVAYEDNEYLLMTDSANDIGIVKRAILKMLQPHIYFNVD